MSWSNGAIVVDGDTSKLEENFAAVPVSDSAEEQREFALNVVHEAFDAGVVEGAYSVYCSGHSDPTVDNDRKSFSLSFSPTTVAAVDETVAE